MDKEPHKIGTFRDLHNTNNMRAMQATVLLYCFLQALYFPLADSCFGGGGGTPPAPPPPTGGGNNGGR